MRMYATLNGAGAGELGHILSRDAKAAYSAPSAVEDQVHMQEDIKTSYGYCRKRLAGVGAYLAMLRRQFRQTHRVVTPMGRVRRLPDLALSSSRDNEIYNRALRQACNTFMQASMADLLKVTMSNIHSCLEQMARDGYEYRITSGSSSSSSGQGAEQAACGNCFSAAVTANAEVLSWGWNSSGCPGQAENATGTIARPPALVAAIGPRFDAPATALAAGGNHALVVVQTSVSDLSAEGRMRSLLPFVAGKTPQTEAHDDAPAAATADVFLSVAERGAGKAGRPSSLVERRFLAHRVVLEARCPKLRELFLVAAAAAATAAAASVAESEGTAAVEKEEDEDSFATAMEEEQEHDGGHSLGNSLGDSLGNSVGVSLTHLGSHFNAATVAALLVYLYTDTLEAPYVNRVNE